MQEVGGSIPPGSTSLRWLRQLRLGKARRGEADDESYVYILEDEDAEHFYLGMTDDLRDRLAKHNSGEVPWVFGQ
jgi:GIY-YIG catalytic domain-containing protein